ncbi:MAG: HK97 gp10 family phage protein [Peptococcaceae bacterium]|jgi:hypothetical protein|nr:HK97 gp10 family phage protein [Peptococcaceae bacterium]
MSETITLAQLEKKLQQLQADLPRILQRTAKLATMKAVEVAAEATPPKAGTGRGGYIGKNMLTGELSAAWNKDSIKEPIKVGNSYITILGNNQSYASFVENGHVLNKHFVPGLYIDKAKGVLARETDPEKKVGLVVGTKTRWVKGEFMAEKGKRAYQKAIESLLRKEIERAMR